MRFAVAAAVLLLGASSLQDVAEAFVPSRQQQSSSHAATPTAPTTISASASLNPPRLSARRITSLGMVATPKQTKPASPAELLKRARRAQGLPEEDDEPPKLFEDDILDDMQQSLLKLEKRVKQGPGSLSVEEVVDLEAATRRILKDMEEKLNGGGMPTDERPAAAAAAATTAPPPPPVSSAAPSSPPPPPRPSVLRPGDTSAVIDTSNDEGPAYTGRGGMGLASGTRNTYVIPGMDEMSPEEYREALQKSVIDRQEERRKANKGVVGNRAGHSYLDSIGWGGAAASLAADPTTVGGAEGGKKGKRKKKKGTTKTKPQPKSQVVAPPAPDDHQPMEHDPVVNYGGQYVPSVHDRQPVSGATRDVIDTSNDEGPAYTGRGGMGLASGTRNTYVIPGMDEMSPEEYRAALQKSVIDMQEERKKARRGVVGNRAGHSYLDSIGWGGASSNLAAENSSGEEGSGQVES